jgi:membrane protease subunit (stomatin/prohibitin family)
MQIPLEVHPPSGEPYQITYVFTAARMKAPITAGMEIPIKIDPQDPQKIAVQWDAQQAGIAAAGGDMAAVTAGMQATYGNAANDAMLAAKANAAAEDPAAKLKKLGDMRDAGLITSEEFDAKKAEILAGM